MKLTLCTAIAALIVIASACSSAERDQRPLAGFTAPTTAAAAATSHDGFVGVVTSRDAAVIAVERGGRIEHIPVRAGQRVAAGDVLAVLDDRAARQNADSARAEVEVARANRRAAALELGDARAKLTVERKLYRQDVTARESVRAAEVAVAMAQSNLARAAAELDAALARANEVERILAETTVRAPRAGVVSHLRVQPGEQLAPGTVLTRIVDPDSLRIRFAVPGDQSGQIAIGQRVSMIADDTGQVVHGVVVSVAPELDPPLRLVIIDAELANDSGESTNPGLIGQVRLLDHDS